MNNMLKKSIFFVLLIMSLQCSYSAPLVPQGNDSEDGNAPNYPHSN